MIKKTYLKRNNEYLILTNDVRPGLNIERRYVNSYEYHGLTRTEDYFTFSNKEEGNKYYFQMLEKGFEVITKAEYEEVEKKFNLLAY